MPKYDHREFAEYARTLSRRELIEQSLKAGLVFGTLGATGLLNRPLSALAQEGKTLSCLGLGVTLQDRMISKFKEDTGIEIKATLGDEIGMMNKMITGGNEIYDTVEENQFMLPPMLEQGVISPIPTEKIPNWALADPEWKNPNALYSPYLYVDPQKQDQLKLVPQIQNADAFAYNPEKITEFGWNATETTWAMVYNRKYAGKVALGDFPTQSIANVLVYLAGSGKIPKLQRQATDPTREEIDRAIEFLLNEKKEGQFRVLWNDYGQLVNLFASEEIWIADSWNPVVEDVKRLGTPCLYALPKEGNRLWFYGIMVSSKAKDPELAYTYANWWLNGWAGAQVATQGYYSPVSSLVKQYLGDVEFGYWYEGKENPERAPYNFREGGSRENRLSKFACFDIWPQEFQYMTKVWNDFKAA